MKFIKKYFNILSIVFIFIFLMSGCTNNTNSNTNSNYSGLKVHYIDVGQGDSELIQVNGKNLLIDAGPDRKSVV